jgi:hypothetical protein
MRDRRGKQVVAAHAPVPGTGWTLASLEDWGIVTQSTARYRNILMIAVVAALLLPPLSQVVASRQQRIRFLEMRRPEDDEAWARVMRDQLHPRLLPVLPGWQLLAHGQAGKRREHDFVDAAILPDGRLMLSIGTVLGSGLPAALAIASTRTLLRASGQRLESLEQSLTQCSASLCLQLEPPLPVRCLVIRLDPRSGWLDYACAGASPLGAEGNHVLQWASPSGDAMGAVPEPRIEVGRVHLDPGGLMLVTGQAMAETHDAEGRSFIQEVLSHLLKEDRLGLEDLAHKVQRAFRSFNQSSRHLDPDMTILLLERRPSPS